MAFTIADAMSGNKYGETSFGEGLQKPDFHGGQGIPFEQVVAECGFTMEQIRGAKRDS